ncbi:hypothetical protein GP486_003334 [Trichoglossum hirsutum]|uniref:Ankyrin repeat protein n=1 Tax=Trichoglossum hirsutum TaxID=265104 RepID=A0A9P8RQU4_9PEZI|nr:hypothetical protein GP486_003334 [Trichoglossum hirsutum]
MTDPFSVGTGIASIIGVALQLTIITKEFASGWKNCPDEVSSLHQELTCLQDVLENLEAFLRNESNHHFEKTSALYSAAGEYVLKLESLRKKLQRHVPTEGNKIRQALERVKWPLERREVQKTLLELQRYAQLFNFAMSIDGCKLLSQTSSDILETLNILRTLSTDVAGLSQQLSQLIQTVVSLPDRSNRIEMISQSLRALESKWDAKNRQRLLDRLSCIDNESKHRKLRKIRHHGTGMWIIDSEPFKDWKEESGSSCLCCYGIPGSGKTILVSSVIDTLKASVTNSPLTVVAYHYCDYSAPNSLEMPSILRATIKQLLEQHSDIPDHITQNLQECCLTDDELLTTYLFLVISLFPKVFLLIDGVDELGKEEQIAVLSILKRLAGSTDSTVKIFTSSRREEPYIVKQLEGFRRIDLSTSNLSSDIARFVKETVKSKIESGELVIRNPSLEQDIVKVLVDGADGMFLWIKFQIAELCEATTDSAIREVLRTLPRGLVATYERILEKITASTGGAGKTIIAIKMFKWIVCAKRPLKIDELKEAVGVEPTDSFLDPDKIPTNDEHLIRCCGNLVVFDTDDRTIRLAHYTVQQFLLSESTKSEQFHFRQLEAELEVGEICVAYLSFSEFETQMTKSKPKRLLPRTEIVGNYIWRQLPLPRIVTEIISFLWRHGVSRAPENQIGQIDYLNLLQNLQQMKPLCETMEQRYRLLRYSIDNWTFHTLKFSEKIDAWRLFRTLAMEKELQLLNQPPKGPDLLHYYGLTAKNDRSLELLRLICQRGHESVLSLLLDAGAIDRRDLEDSSLVSDATKFQHEGVLKLLLENGANPNARDDRGNPVIYIAAMNSHEAAIKMLLAHEADVNSAGFLGSTALHLFAGYGHEAIVRLLIEKGADIKAKDNRGISALCSAASGGHDLVMRLLIERGVDVDATSNQGETVLHWAAKTGQPAAVQLLLEKGVNIEATNSDGRTALYLAVRTGNVAVMQLLLENGADVDVTDHTGLTGLSLAAIKGHKAALQLLIKNGADINAGDRYGNTALHQAATGGRELVIPLLIEKGADIKAKDNRDQTALFRAARFGREEIVQLLIDMGAEAEKNIEGETALFAAAWNGHSEVVRILVEKGVDINVENSTGDTALHGTANRGHHALVRLMAEMGADVNAKNNDGKTPLHSVAISMANSVNPEKGKRDYNATVRVLLEKGADVKAKDNFGRTPLRYATDAKCEPLVRLLKSA